MTLVGGRIAGGWRAFCLDLHAVKFTFGADTLAHDLRVAPFAARKILTIRDGFLDRPR